MKNRNEEDIKYALALSVVSDYRNSHKIPTEETKMRDLKMAYDLIRDMVERPHPCPKCNHSMTFYENKERF